MSLSFADAFNEVKNRSFIPLDGFWIIRMVRVSESTFEAHLFRRTDTSKPNWRGPAMDPNKFRYFHIDHKNTEATDYTPVSDPAVAIDPADPKCHAMLTHEEGYGWTVTMLRPQPLLTLFQVAAMVPECIHMGEFFAALNNRTSFSTKETMEVLHQLDLAGRHLYGVGPKQRALRMRIDG